MHAPRLFAVLSVALAGCGSCADKPKGASGDDAGATPAPSFAAPSVRPARSTGTAPTAPPAQAELAAPDGCPRADTAVWLLVEGAGAVGLHRFDAVTRKATRVGDVACAPRYLAVDRAGTLYGLSTAGKLFTLSARDASCAPTKLRPGQQGFARFYMSFVFDGERETLYASDEHLDGDEPAKSLGLAVIDTKSFKLQRLGKLDNPDPENTEPCALAGTGDGRLYAVCTGAEVWRVGKLAPDAGDARDARVPVESVVVNARWMNPTRPRPVAFWGGALVWFTPACDDDARDAHCAEKGARVVSYSLVDHAPRVLVQDLGVKVIAAATSTCAPLF